MRRGWVWPIRPATPRPISRQIFGNWVDLPDPVSPQTITTWWSRMAAAMSSRRAEIGRSGSKDNFGTAFRRASQRPSDCRKSFSSRSSRFWSSGLPSRAAAWIAPQAHCAGDAGRRSSPARFGVQVHPVGTSRSFVVSLRKTQFSIVPESRHRSPCKNNILESLSNRLLVAAKPIYQSPYGVEFRAVQTALGPNAVFFLFFSHLALQIVLIIYTRSALTLEENQAKLMY